MRSALCAFFRPACSLVMFPLRLSSYAATTAFLALSLRRVKERGSSAACAGRCRCRNSRPWGFRGAEQQSTFHLQIQINKTRAVHSPGIDALGFEFTNAQLTPALGAAKHPKVRTPMTPELGQFHFQPKSSHFDTGGYFRLIVKTALIFPILRR